MSTTHRVTIDLPTPVPGSDAVITLDGEDITKGLVGFALKGSAGEINTLTLDLHLPTYQVNGELRVEISGETRELLFKLGWTEPSAAATPATEK